MEKRSLVSGIAGTHRSQGILSLLAEVPRHVDANIDANAGEILLKGFEMYLSCV